MVEITPVDGGFWRWLMAWALPTLNHNGGHGLLIWKMADLHMINMMIDLSKLVFFYSKPLDNQKVYHIVRCEGHLATYILMIDTLLHRITRLICPHQWKSHHLTRMLPAIWSLNQHFINNLILNTSYPLVSVNKKLWKITILHGKTHYFHGQVQ